MAKYGTFVRTSDFNSKYFMGVISTHYKEAPLHFLMVRKSYIYIEILYKILKKLKSLVSNGLVLQLKKITRKESLKDI